MLYGYNILISPFCELRLREFISGHTASAWQGRTRHWLSSFPPCVLSTVPCSAACRSTEFWKCLNGHPIVLKLYSKERSIGTAALVSAQCVEASGWITNLMQDQDVLWQLNHQSLTAVLLPAWTCDVLSLLVDNAGHLFHHCPLSAVALKIHFLPNTCLSYSDS